MLLIQKEGNKVFVRRNNVKERWLRRSFVYKIKELGCWVCGITNPVVIELHHEDKKDKELSAVLGWADRNVFLDELSKCVPLCANCHKQLHAGQIMLLSVDRLNREWLEKTWEVTCTLNST